MTGRSTPATLSWLHADRAAQRRIWQARCLQRARTARNFPGVFPTALAAQHGTPMSDRVTNRDHFRQGMVIYLDNPHDSNPFGHIVTMVGRNKAGEIIVDTNDALIAGGGSIVTLDWFPANWGVPVVFAAKSLNGFDLDLGRAGEPQKHKHPKPQHHVKPTLDNVQYALHRMDKAIAHWKAEGKHPGLVKALTKDRAEIKQTLDQFGR